ncbi:hypothetical protein [Cereibacter changlensis]|uniref:hypothetical protein n=1 Tax=Cereibacter changlensis TaxID=402884 RepID=UPI0040339988
MAYMLKLPNERGEQLRQIADAENKTVVDLITDFIRQKIAEGVIPADLPNVELETTEAGMNVALPGFAGSLPAVEIPSFTAALRSMALKMPPGSEGSKQRLADFSSAFTGVKLKRMGAGVRLVSPITGKEYSLASSVAADLADQIERETK